MFLNMCGRNIKGERKNDKIGEVVMGDRSGSFQMVSGKFWNVLFMIGSFY